jgi:hypothetical protein
MTSFRLVVKTWAQCVLVISLLSFSTATWAGAYIFAGESNGIDLVLHPQGYFGTGGVIPLKVCIVEDTPNEVAMEQSVRNMIAVYNQLLPTTGNLRNLGVNALDFESVALHELGHCIGKAHVNAASESGLPTATINSTKATDGEDNVLNPGAGVDGVIGSSDDVRGDDVNLHWFRTSNNNPFTIDYQTVDSTTYARDLSSLPSGHLFATNGDKNVGQVLLNTPNTEAVMQQGTRWAEVQRTLTPDGVATMQYAMSGADEIAGISDDYSYQLSFSTPSDCDIFISFDIPTETGLAYCSVGGQFISSPPGTRHARITTADMHFNPTDYTWHFNTANPCSESFLVAQDQWSLFTPGCSLGISTTTSAVVTEALGDDFTGAYRSTWWVYEWDAASEAYQILESTDELKTGGGYWIYSTEADHSVDIEGQFNGAPDILLSGSAAPSGTQNLIGHPFDFTVKWADVQIIYDDGAGERILTMTQAVSEGWLDATFNKSECGGYEPYDINGSGTVGYLNASDGIWVRSYVDGARLRVPSKQALSPPPSPPDPCPAEEQVTAEVFASSAESLGSEETATTETARPESEYKIQDDGSWYARIIIESGKYRDKGNVFGQRSDAKIGQDHRDLEELAPFDETYLTVVFPHEDWEPEPWAYTTDFRSTSKNPQGEWVFAVMSSIDIEDISMRLEGPENILRKGKLRDLETGKLVKFRDGVYTFEANPGVRYFSFSVGKK